MSSPLPPLPLLSACELTAIRTAAETTLDTPVTIAHITRTATAGGTSEASALLATCNARFAPPTAPILAQFANRIGNQQAWVVSIATSVTPVPSPGDTVTITADGSVYTIHAVLQPQSFSTLNQLLVGKSV